MEIGCVGSARESTARDVNLSNLVKMEAMGGMAPSATPLVERLMDTGGAATLGRASLGRKTSPRGSPEMWRSVTCRWATAEGSQSIAMMANFIPTDMELRYRANLLLHLGDCAKADTQMRRVVTIAGPLPRLRIDTAQPSGAEGWRARTPLVTAVKVVGMGAVVITLGRRVGG